MNYTLAKPKSIAKTFVFIFNLSLYFISSSTMISHNHLLLINLTLISFISNEISKYNKLCDFYKKSQGCYIYVKRHKLDYMLNNLKRKKKINNI